MNSIKNNIKKHKNKYISVALVVASVVGLKKIG